MAWNCSLFCGIIFIFVADFKRVHLMNIIFEDNDLEELVTTGRNNKYKKYAKDAKFMQALVRDYNTMSAVSSTASLSQYSYLHYEKLENCDLSSIRVMNGRVERILFRETQEGLVITIIELDNTHYGNKK